MFFNLFKKEIKISYGITVCTEATELKSLLEILIPLIDQNDEIIVLQDITIKNLLVSELLDNYKKNVIVKEAFLNKDFASFKNNFLSIAKGDYLFQIDADEIPKASLIKNLKSIILNAKRYDCFRVPRINIVNGYTVEHVNKWNWNINDKNYINFPDYQPRIIKLNGLIKWKNKLHEDLTGFKKRFDLPADEDFCLIHIKDIERQQKQVDFYEKITDKNLH